MRIEFFDEEIFVLFLETEIDMKKNTWFILFPKSTPLRNTWLIDNRADAFDLEDDLELRIFEQFCFLKPKLPIGKFHFIDIFISLSLSLGFPNSGLLNRCPKPSIEHCLKNGTRIPHDELLELKTFLTSTTTRKAKVVKPKRFIEPVW
jgi:hypothetical protein